MWNVIKWKATGAALLAPIVVLAAGVEEGAGVSTDGQVQQLARAQRSVQLAVAPAGQRLVSVGERGIVLLSDDQGRSWRQVPAPVATTLTGVQFADGRNGWAVGHGGVVLATRDGGENWQQVLDGAKAADIELAAARRAADEAPGEHTARRLREAERLVQDGADKPFLAVYFADARRGIVAGAYGLLFATEDGGEHWVSMMGRIDNPGAWHLYAVAAAGEGLVIAGEQGRLFRSNAWGEDLVPVATPYAGTWFGVLAGRDGSLLAYGLRGNAYRSADRGDTWERVELPPVSLSGGAVMGDGRLILANEAGQLFESTDGGRSFAERAVPEAFPFTGAAQASDGGLVLSGVRGLVRLAAGAVRGTMP